MFGLVHNVQTVLLVQESQFDPQDSQTLEVEFAKKVVGQVAWHKFVEVTRKNPVEHKVHWVLLEQESQLLSQEAQVLSVVFGKKVAGHDE